MVTDKVQSDVKVTRHAQSPVLARYSLCHITHEDRMRARFAKPFERVNCPDCRVIINFCRTFSPKYESECTS